MDDQCLGIAHEKFGAEDAVSIRIGCLLTGFVTRLFSRDEVVAPGRVEVVHRSQQYIALNRGYSK
jgi:hypothetical protein